MRWWKNYWNTKPLNRKNEKLRWLSNCRVHLFTSSSYKKHMLNSGLPRSPIDKIYVHSSFISHIT
jgi:hypothetical protein